MPLLVKGSPRLFPYATIPNFNFKVFKTSLTNRDLTVKMTRGEIRGFENALQRAEDCQSSSLEDEQTLISCNLAVRGLNTTFTAQTQGDSLLGTRKTIWVDVTVRDTVAHFEASAPAGGKGTLRSFVIDHILLDVQYSRYLSLNEGRRQKFMEEIADRVKDELRRIFLNDYNKVLRRAVKSVTFPEESDL
ncbi:hypothetical protein V5799_029055 [Amblyomma americanum]|uniref:Uncharacterized protein n=1 Tax=Amblyomma americanum TaxID=6943 RepID=A0AAQ4ESC7_AMBAM